VAILAIFTGTGIDKAMYDTLRNEARWHEDRPAGAMLHAAAFDDKGDIHVADVWNSQAELDAFVGGRLMPAFQKHNIPAPEVQIYTLHNLDAFPSISEHILK
jgi:hypothetical protein